MKRNHYIGFAVAALLAAASAFALTGCVSADNQTVKPTEATSPITPASGPNKDPDFLKLEAEYGVRLGVYALDTGSGETVEFRADERFGFASTYKALAAGAVLSATRPDRLNEIVLYDENDIVTHSPVTEKHTITGMPLRDVAAAALQYSDNTAGNLLLKELGGPTGFDAALNKIGDTTTKSSRKETDLNQVAPGDTRDTSTPRALAESLRSYTLGNALNSSHRSMLNDWLKGNTTGANLIRAGVPAGWIVGDKTGAADYGTRNDIAIVWPPNREPIVVAVLSDKPAADAKYDDALIASTTRVVVKMLGGHQSPAADAAGSGAGAAAPGGRVFHMKVGECFDVRKDQLNRAAGLISCDRPHDDEVYAVYELPEDTAYPADTDQFFAAPTEGCIDRFSDFVGIPYESSALEITLDITSADEWAAGDHRIWCLVYKPDDTTTGSLANTKF